jgi:hypothetical protein
MILINIQPSLSSCLAIFSPLTCWYISPMSLNEEYASQA